MIGFWYDTERPARARVRSSKHETATLTLSLTRYDDHAPTSMTSHLSLSLSFVKGGCDIATAAGGGKGATENIT